MCLLGLLPAGHFDDVSVRRGLLFLFGDVEDLLDGNEHATERERERERETKMVPSTFGRRQRIDKTITSSTSSSSTPRVDSRPPSTTTSIHRGSIELRCRRCSGEWVPGFLPGSSSFGPYGGVTDVVIVDEKKNKKK